MGLCGAWMNAGRKWRCQAFRAKTHKGEFHHRAMAATIAFVAIDIDKQVHYWQSGAEEALRSAELLIANGRWALGLFLAHLALEKILKALVVRKVRELPPRTHDLLWLARLAAAEPPAHILAALGEFQAYCLAGRYPDSGSADMDEPMAKSELARAREAYTWLQNQFSR